MKGPPLLVLALLPALFAAPGVCAPAGQRPERIIVHIPLAFNDRTPVSRSELRGLLSELSLLGAVAEHRGYGTYVDSRRRVSVEPVDHVVVTTSSARAERIIVSVLHRLRRDLHQESALAEVVPDPRSWHDEKWRVQFDVAISAQGARCDRICTALRRLLDDAGGGDSEYDQGNRAHLISSVPLKAASHVRAALCAMHVSFIERSAGFVLVTS